MKRTVSILLALVLILGISIPAFAADTQDITLTVTSPYQSTATIKFTKVHTIESADNSLSITIASDGAINVVSGTFLALDFDVTSFNAGEVIKPTDYKFSSFYGATVVGGKFDGYSISILSSDTVGTSNVTAGELSGTDTTPTPAPVPSPTPTPTPTPVPAPAPAPTEISAIDTAVKHGLIPDHLQGDYQKELTRADFCAFAASFYESFTGVSFQGKSEITERKTFADTSDISIEKMAGLGIVTGIGNNKFAPDDRLTREQAAVIFTKLMEKLGKNTEAAFTYADSASTSAWAQPAVRYVLSCDVMSLDAANQFKPKGTFTREQCIEAFAALYMAEYSKWAE